MRNNEKSLKELCSKWQQLLGLSHWNIGVKVVRGVEINDSCAQIDYSPVEEQALIRIKSEDDFHGYYQYDMESTIVHELLHIIFDSTENKSYEQALSRIARCLVKLKNRTEADNVEMQNS